MIECIHCGLMVPDDALDHWRECPAHPAREALAAAVARAERAEADLTSARKDYGISVAYWQERAEREKAQYDALVRNREIDSEPAPCDRCDCEDLDRAEAEAAAWKERAERARAWVHRAWGSTGWGWPREYLDAVADNPPEKPGE